MLLRTILDWTLSTAFMLCLSLAIAIGVWAAHQPVGGIAVQPASVAFADAD